MNVDNNSFSHHSYLLSELAGSVGNFGTVLPLLFAVSFSCGMNVSLMLLWAAVWYIITGLYYRIPIPVEPLKAEGPIPLPRWVPPHLMVPSGFLLGGKFLCMGFFGWLTGFGGLILDLALGGDSTALE